MCCSFTSPLIVQIPGSDELKSKPTQHSVKELLSIGIQPDILVCRSDTPFTEEIRRKISLFCNVDPSCVIRAFTAPREHPAPVFLRSHHVHQNDFSVAAFQQGNIHGKKEPSRLRLSGRNSSSGIPGNNSNRIAERAS